MQSDFKSGFAAIIGKPNVGKSTLLNALVGQKVAIVSPKPQTTRNRIAGVLTRPGVQAVFLDTPGIHAPKTKLGQEMIRAAQRALEDTEAVVFVVEAGGITARDEEIITRYSKTKAAKILVINKIDAVSKETLVKDIQALSVYDMDEVIPISALTGDGVQIVEKAIMSRLPTGPKYFPDDYITDMPERFLIAEMIREKALLKLEQEIPHGIGVEIMRIQTAPSGVTHIDATVYCEKDSHKNIIIGKHGQMLGFIGSQARADAERLLGCQINLKLWVKVVPGWRDKIGDLRSLGYIEK